MDSNDFELLLATVREFKADIDSRMDRLEGKLDDMASTYVSKEMFQLSVQQQNASIAEIKTMSEHKADFAERLKLSVLPVLLSLLVTLGGSWVAHNQSVAPAEPLPITIHVTH